MTLCFIVEDDQRHRKMICSVLTHEGYQTSEFDRGKMALAALEQEQPEILILDLGLPDIHGMELIPRILKILPHIRIIVITGNDSVRDAVKALQMGVRHYLVKPWDHHELCIILERESQALIRSQNQMRQQDAHICGRLSPTMKDLSNKVKKLAMSPLTPVFIEGETGTGKEVLAREIHLQTKCKGEFVAFNCAAMPGELIESELFGHEKGAYTGATSRKRGLIELAQNGTLLLDEITEMPLVLQSKLLRFIQEHAFRRVGSNHEIACPCRIIATSNRNIKHSIQDNLLREDLFYRLAVVHLTIPPLRERPEDIIALAECLLKELKASMPTCEKRFAEEIYPLLIKYDWPGNIRELKNRIERALVLSSGQTIAPNDLDLPSGFQNKTKPSKNEFTGRVKSQPTLQEIMQALHESEGNISFTARRLNLPRHRLRYILKKEKLTR